MELQHKQFGELAPIPMVPIGEIGRMRSANTDGETSVDEWADSPDAQDHRSDKVRHYITKTGTIPGHLTATPSGKILIDGNHRYKEARDAGITHLPVLRDRKDPRYHQ